jgi:hypothetical protein
MTLSLSSFDSQQENEFDPHNTCLRSSANLQLAYLDAGYSWMDSVNAGIEYYNFVWKMNHLNYCNYGQE